jgi:hypothetical protein
MGLGIRRRTPARCDQTSMVGKNISNPFVAS